MSVVLASTSLARRALMDGLGIPYVAVSPGVDETIPAGFTVEQAVAHLAEKKARAVHMRSAVDTLVIGADQLVSLDGAPLGKPPNEDAAKAQLEKLRGRTHEIITGVCVIKDGFCEIKTDTARLTMWPDIDIDAYVATGEWQGCAGAYRIEARGQALFQRIDGDRTSIQGLPMQLVITLLKHAGYRFFF